MTFPLALAVGIEGADEVMELELAEIMQRRGIARAPENPSPPGLGVALGRSPSAGRKKSPNSQRIIRSADSAAPGLRSERSNRSLVGPIDLR